MLKLYTDAAVKGNPGPAGIGILITGLDKQIQQHYPATTMTNHEAEFAAAIAGFQFLIDIGQADQSVAFFSDSKIVIDGMTKHYAKHFQPQVDQLVTLSQQFPLVIPAWVADRQNKGAHQLAQQGLSQALDQA